MNIIHTFALLITFGKDRRHISDVTVKELQSVKMKRVSSLWFWLHVKVTLTADANLLGSLTYTANVAVCFNNLFWDYYEC